MAGIFTIDTGKTTGWAYMPSADGEVSFGHWELGGGIKEAGLSLSNLYAKLDAAFSLHKPKLVVKEGAIKTKFDTPEKLVFMYGLHGIVELLAYKHGAQMTEINPNSLKLQFADNGNATKDDMVFICRRMKFDVLDHNAADALALLIVTARNRINGFHL